MQIGTLENKLKKKSRTSLANMRESIGYLSGAVRRLLIKQREIIKIEIPMGESENMRCGLD